ncbi:cytochrome b [Pseudomonas sp. PP3]|uniref:cytochrome b n=1 Tax=Pseudomonas sp. PP3 TaxID=2815936 RepID=UPI001BB0C772|nr:cytochrome b [Pseudomonas sp. PP3]
MTTPSHHFARLTRFLHWLMAFMVISMLFIGAGITASVSERHEWLLDLHKPLGIAILALVIVRIIGRLSSRTPPLPLDLPEWQVAAAKLSHFLLYGLMLVMPLLGWAMISAAGDPVMLSDAVRLPSLISHNAETYAQLRRAHGYLAYLFFLTILAHLGAALFHAWIRRDAVFASMARGTPKR